MAARQTNLNLNGDIGYYLDSRFMIQDYFTMTSIYTRHADFGGCTFLATDVGPMVLFFFVSSKLVPATKQDLTFLPNGILDGTSLQLGNLCTSPPRVAMLVHQLVVPMHPKMQKGQFRQIFHHE